MYRAEDKYSCSNNELFLLQSRIDSILQADSNQYSPEGYSIISLYFDDLYDTHFQDAIDGNSIRRKYRIRIYNNSFDTIKLEVKFKQYNRVMKKSKTISYSDMCTLLDGNPIDCTNSPDDPATLFNFAIKESCLRPKVIVAYERKAYVFSSGNVRITFDRNIRSSNLIQKFGNPDLIYDFPDERNAILEVKYDEFLPGFIAQLLELGNMQQISYSKYRICREVYTKENI